VIVAPGETAAFLDPWPVGTLERPELADLLGRLGIGTLGRFAALPAGHVLGRFGVDGAACQRVAQGIEGEWPGFRTVSPRGGRLGGEGSGPSGSGGPGQPGFWGGQAGAAARAGRALARVQQLLGPEAVVTGRLAGRPGTGRAGPSDPLVQAPPRNLGNRWAAAGGDSPRSSVAGTGPAAGPGHRAEPAGAGAAGRQRWPSGRGQRGAGWSAPAPPGCRWTGGRGRRWRAGPGRGPRTNDGGRSPGARPVCRWSPGSAKRICSRASGAAGGWREPTTEPPGRYAELHCHSNFSFLDGASHPEELVAEAARLGLGALALTDHDGLYGVVRFAETARAVGLASVFGAELTLVPSTGRDGRPGPAAASAPPPRTGAHDGHWLVLTGCRKGAVPSRPDRRRARTRRRARARPKLTRCSGMRT
jgi:hypothetical protein